jgi:hypothetical protein
LLAEAQLDRLAITGIAVQTHPGGGLADRGAQLRGRHGDAGRHGAVLGAVEAHHDMEMHEPARLKLGDLRIRDPHELAPPALAHAGAGGEDAAQLDDEAVPQRRGVPVPQHCALVVVAGRVDRGAQLGVAVVVPAPATAWPAVVADRVHRPERRRRQRGEDLRMLGDRLGHALSAAGQSRVHELPHVAAVLVRA